MTPSEAEDVIRVLVQLWPQMTAMEAHMIDVWRRTLTPLQATKEEVIEALKTFRAEQDRPIRPEPRDVRRMFRRTKASRPTPEPRCYIVYLGPPKTISWGYFSFKNRPGRTLIVERPDEADAIAKRFEQKYGGPWAVYNFTRPPLDKVDDCLSYIEHDTADICDAARRTQEAQ